ncbi:MAG TPA: D-alanine--D-alanine ligase [Planctomycetaceae bacterium]|nr:D-alanine--D-alanine ligase [Planctomycetaceae bacterium]
MGPHLESQSSRKLRLAVLRGGTSAERVISLKSGQAVSRALVELGHAVHEIDPAVIDVSCCDWGAFDAAFVALHGKFGEDGQIQEILEKAHLPYTGSGVAASRLAFSKSASKERFFQHGVPTAPYVLIHESDTSHRILQQAVQLGFPLVVKPDTQGSSLGVSIVHSADDLPAALARCFHYDAFGLLERALDGSEWTVGMLDERPLPAIRIETGRAFFDYHAKYEDETTHYNFEYDDSAEHVDHVVEAARNACAAVGTSGLARVDLIVDRSVRPHVLEVNTVPGLTDHSLVPKAAARQGMTLADLCQHCLQSALRQARVRAASRTGSG